MIPFEPEEVLIYDDEHWIILRKKREMARIYMEPLKDLGLSPKLYGSVARGDVHIKSDVDIVVEKPPCPFSLVDHILLDRFSDPISREIIQSTPKSTPKVYIKYSGDVTISYPLSQLAENESFFYRFGGVLSLQELDEVRVPGVNKKLKLIYPTNEGHAATSIIGKESLVAGILRIPLKVVMERAMILARRKVEGTTGIYLTYRLDPGESVEEAVQKLMRLKKGFRNRMTPEVVK